MTGLQAPHQSASVAPLCCTISYRAWCSPIVRTRSLTRQQENRRCSVTAAAAASGAPRHTLFTAAALSSLAEGLQVASTSKQRRMHRMLRDVGRAATDCGNDKLFRSPQTLTAWVAETAAKVDGRDAADMVLIFSALQTAAKQIAFAVSQAAIQQVGGSFLAADVPDVSSARDAPKQLDLIANEILKSALASTGLVAVVASEEDDEPVHIDDNGRYVVVFDPLDGSRNIECSIPTGTIFGIYVLTDGHQSGQSLAEVVLRQGSELLASGYALYSSATMLVATLGGGSAAGFTLDTTIGEFVATHPDLRIPPRGQIYSLNDARYPDWPDGLRQYIDDVRAGRGQSGKQYSARYVCSLVADVHRTLCYGGWAANPRSHLRLVYEGAPLAFLLKNAGGKGTDGKRDLLTIKPASTHERLPVFLGSPEDIDELLGYGDVQQTSNKTYTV